MVGDTMVGDTMVDGIMVANLTTHDRLNNAILPISENDKNRAEMIYCAYRARAIRRTNRQ